jgi:phage baseplate assembly protein V
MTITELLRLIQNLLRTGAVEEVDLTQNPPVCRVRSGKNLTEWRPFMTFRAGTTKTWEPLTVGEEVLLLSPGGELANCIVLAGLNSDDNPAPSHSADEHITVYPDGARIEYNHVTSALKVTGIDSASVNAKSTITANCKDAHINATNSVQIDCKNAVVNCTDKALVKAANGIELDGDGSGDSSGVVRRCDPCAFTGADHPVSSILVKASK